MKVIPLLKHKNENAKTILAPPPPSSAPLPAKSIEKETLSFTPPIKNSFSEHSTPASFNFSTNRQLFTDQYQCQQNFFNPINFDNNKLNQNFFKPICMPLTTFLSNEYKPVVPNANNYELPSNNLLIQDFLHDNNVNHNNNVVSSKISSSLSALIPTTSTVVSLSQMISPLNKNLDSTQQTVQSIFSSNAVKTSLLNSTIAEKRSKKKNEILVNNLGKIHKNSVSATANEQNSTVDTNITLWQFLLELLSSGQYSSYLQWTNNEGEFKLIDAEAVATLWGLRKNKKSMNYDKLSRAIRYYYDKNIIKKVVGQKFVYRFVIKDEGGLMELNKISSSVKKNTTKNNYCVNSTNKFNNLPYNVNHLTNSLNTISTKTTLEHQNLPISTTTSSPTNSICSSLSSIESSSGVSSAGTFSDITFNNNNLCNQNNVLLEPTLKIINHEIESKNNQLFAIETLSTSSVNFNENIQTESTKSLLVNTTTQSYTSQTNLNVENVPPKNNVGLTRKRKNVSDFNINDALNKNEVSNNSFTLQSPNKSAFFSCNKNILNFNNNYNTQFPCSSSSPNFEPKLNCSNSGSLSRRARPQPLDLTSVNNFASVNNLMTVAASSSPILQTNTSPLINLAAAQLSAKLICQQQQQSPILTFLSRFSPAFIAQSPIVAQSQLNLFGTTSNNLSPLCTPIRQKTIAPNASNMWNAALAELSSNNANNVSHLHSLNKSMIYQNISNQPLNSPLFQNNAQFFQFPPNPTTVAAAAFAAANFGTNGIINTPTNSQLTMLQLAVLDSPNAPAQSPFFNAAMSLNTPSAQTKNFNVTNLSTSTTFNCLNNNFNAGFNGTNKSPDPLKTPRDFRDIVLENQFTLLNGTVKRC